MLSSLNVSQLLLNDVRQDTNFIYMGCMWDVYANCRKRGKLSMVITHTITITYRNNLILRLIFLVVIDYHLFTSV